MSYYMDQQFDLSAVSHSTYVADASTLQLHRLTAVTPEYNPLNSISVI